MASDQELTVEQRQYCDGLGYCLKRSQPSLPAQSEMLAKVVEWQPIETAPKDGTKFDAWVPDAFGGHRMTGLSFNNRGKLRQHGLLTDAELPRWPTHWMPLPAPPAREALALCRGGEDG